MFKIFTHISFIHRMIKFWNNTILRQRNILLKNTYFRILNI